METIDVSQVIVGERARKDLGDLTELKESMATLGQLQPIGLAPGNDLLFGGRRLAVSGVKPKGAYPGVLTDVLTVLVEAWGKDPASVDALLISGMAKVLGVYGDQVDLDRMVTSLSAMAPGLLKSKARGRAEVVRTRVADMVAWFIVDQYNRGKRKGNLPAWEI